MKVILMGLLLAVLASPLTVLADADENTSNIEYIDSASYDDDTVFPLTFQTTARLNLRPAPSTDNARIKLVEQGVRVQVYSFGCGEWFAVEVNGRAGFMHSDHLREASAPVVNTALSVAPSATVVSDGAVELLSWSYVRSIFPKHTAITVTDVRTGLVYQVTAFSLGNHADVETVTAADTAIFHSTYNYRWNWAPRPIIVQIGDRRIAASINGMPHGGGVVSGNNMNGHVCIHFYGSRTHNGNRNHERDHQRAVMEAFNAFN